MKERRTIERHHLIHYLRVFDDQTGEAVGNLADINPEGIMLLTEEPIEKGTSFSFHMEFPEEIDGKTRLQYEATTSWCGEDEKYPNLYSVGFKLGEISAEDREIIEYLIELYRD